MPGSESSDLDLPQRRRRVGVVVEAVAQEPLDRPRGVLTNGAAGMVQKVDQSGENPLPALHGGVVGRISIVEWERMGFLFQRPPHQELQRLLRLRAPVHFHGDDHRRRAGCDDHQNDGAEESHAGNNVPARGTVRSDPAS